ncbi:MAG: MAPEG family protein [Gammaproteobacteria bacterium]|nr:MAPEG family protein [Gammaproteobacteria bacterium]
MSYELKWLIYTTVLTSLLWVPYILNRISVRGLLPAMGYADETAAPHAPWAARAMKAHSNAVENLVLFAPLVLALHVLGISNDTTQMAVLVYFAMRVVHYFAYVFAVPVLRTLVFAVSWVALLALAYQALGGL